MTKVIHSPWKELAKRGSTNQSIRSAPMKQMRPPPGETLIATAALAVSALKSRVSESRT